MKAVCIWILGVLFLSACSVMPADVEQAALPPIEFPELIRQAANYRGQTVILGGYVSEVENLEDHTRMVAVQAPLGFRREPKSKDLSQGRLIVIYKGFLDPAVYTEGRKITIAGRLLGSSATEEKVARFPYVRVELEDLNLWPEERQRNRDYYYPDPYWRYPYHPWGWRHPYWW